VVINYLIKYPADKIKLEAHADARRRDTYNLARSNKRAILVNDYVLSKGIKPDRTFSIKGFGKKNTK
jgi:outer membrane protein OmpA-like peptidoglycan-associated protein